MSCRRRDAANFIGCRGSGHRKLCNCQCWSCDECLHEHWSVHERENLLTLPWKPTHNPPSKRELETWPKHRGGLYTKECPDTVHRPKFICPKPTCRRSLKPFYDPVKNEYEFMNKFRGNWGVRPNPKVDPILRQVVRNERKNGRMPTEVNAILSIPGGDQMLLEKFRNRKKEGEDMSEVELEALKWTSQWSWWMEVEKRCPGCAGEVVRVGSNFRIPGRRDEKGWKRVMGWLEEGRDLEAMFVCCLRVEGHRKMVEKALEVRKGRGVVEVECPWREDWTVGVLTGV